MSFQRFRAVLGTDLRFQFTRPLVWVLIVLLGFMSFGLSAGNVQIASGDSTVGGQKAWLTSEFAVAQIFPLITFLLYSFFVAIGSGMAVPRDDELNVGPVLHATKLRPSEYVAGKFVAVLLTFLAILAVHLLFQVVFNHLWPHDDADKIRGPFLLANYLRPALFLALPCILFFCGSAFVVGEITRKPILIFATPVAFFLVCIFFLFDWSPTWLDPRINSFLMWIEPSGFRWINETWLKVDRGVQFYNHEPVVYDVPFLVSRLVYAGLGLFLPFLSVRHVERTLRGTSAPRRRKKGVIAEPPAESGIEIAPRRPLADFGMTASPPGFLRVVLDVARFEARTLRGQPGLYLFVPIILLQTIFTLLFQVGAFSTPILLTPGTAAVGSMNTLTLLVCLLLLFYTVESVLRERNTGLAPVYYATPSRTAAFLLGKAIANGIVGGVLLLATLIGIFFVLLFQGKVAMDLGPFLLVWGLLLVPTFLVWASFVTAILAISGNRYFTYAVGLGAFIFTGWKQVKGEVNWVGNWDLWSVTTWTDFGGVDPNGAALFLNRLFYFAVMAFLLALTVRVFPRREHDSTRIVDRLRPRALLRSTWRLAPFAVVAATIGMVLHVQVGQGFQSESAEKREKQYWARNLATWADAEIPQIAGVDLDVELDPPARSFKVRGHYDLVNASGEEMRRAPMSVGDHFESVEWTLNGETVEPQDQARLYVFSLDPPLAPGDTVRIGFSHEGRYPKGFTKNGGGMDNFILPSGVVLTSFNTGFVPVPYFEPERGVDEENMTEPVDYEDGYHEGKTPPALGSGVRFPVRTRISGPAEYAYHGVGVRKEETVEDGIRTVVWESDFPVNFFNVVAGKWDVWEGEGVKIYHHPEHTYNLEEMGEALEGARKYYSEWFYPYPWEDLRVNEFAGLGNYAQGFPTNITFSESIGFLTRSSPEVQAAFLVTAHEAAHQWWANILMPGEGPGGNLLAEGTAHFSTILLTRELKGDGARREFCMRLEESYGENRQVDSEKPLVWVDGSKAGDTTVTYDKGGWVFWMLLRHLGEEAGLAGYRDFIERYSGHDDFPLLQDFLAVMREQATDVEAYDDFVSQWFLEVVVPEYRLAEVEKESAESGWAVTARIENVGTGRFPLTVAAVRGERADNEMDPTEGDHEPWQDERVVVTLGPGESTEITLRCGFEPEELIVDPDVEVLMLQRDRAKISL